jgi:hypothetical protein
VLPLSRRRFLALLAAAPVAAAGCVDGGSTGLPPAAADRLTAFLSDPAGAASLGPLVEDPGLVADPLAAIAPDGADPAGWLEAVDDDGFAAQVREATVADLQGGRVVEVGGWLLGRTEAAICVLADVAFLGAGERATPGG